jgi:hypothetical protein
VPHHRSETVLQQFGAVCGNDFSVKSHQLLSDMVNTRSLTRSSHPQQPQPMQPPPSAPGASNDPDLRDFLKSMVESMEVLRKQNEELNARITAAEARSSEKERERTERREKERRDRAHREKRPVNPRRRTMRVPSRGRMRKTETNLVARMEDLGGVGPIERSPHAKNLGARRRRAKGLAKRGAKEKCLTDQGDTEKNPTMKGLRGLSKATRRQR